MKPAHEKYIPFVPLKMARRAWPDRELKAPPVWCSVDLRDGNQALIDPMNVREKLELFHTLVDIGVKEIEVGFPSASETEYEFIRTLIEGGHIPDDVTIQVLVQAREHLIRRTFEAIDGAKHVIFHFYNSTSTLQRKVVFHTDVEGVKKIAVDAARLIRELSQPAPRRGDGSAVRVLPGVLHGHRDGRRRRDLPGGDRGHRCHAGAQGDPQPPHHRGELYAQLLR